MTLLLGEGRPAIIIRQARWKAALLFMVSMLFAIGGGLMTGDTQARLPGWLGLAFFGLCAAVGAVQLVWPGRLTLSPEGMTLETMGRRREWTWDQVDGFRTWSINRTTLVTFDDLKASPGLMQDLNAGLDAGAASLPGQWRISPQALVELLHTAKAQWG